MTLDDFLTRLDKPLKLRGKYIARCPNHEDGTPSLSIKSEGGKILIHCFAGCSTENVLASMDLKFPDLYEDERNGYVAREHVRPRMMSAADIEDRLLFADSVPRPLPNALKPVPSLDPSLIPNPLRPWLVDVAERMQCPIEFPAVAALVAAGAVIGNSVVVRPKAHDPWIVVPNIWGACVAPPGTLKTPSVNEAMRFVKEIERRENSLFEAVRGELAIDLETRDAEQKAIRHQLQQSFTPANRRAAKPGDSAGVIVDREALKRRLRELDEMVAPKPKRLLTSDATVEKLGELLNDNPRGLLNVRDELSGFIDSLDKVGREGDRSFYLETWDGLGSHSVDRIGRGSLRINNLTLSLFGTIQPAVIAPLLKSFGPKGVDDGFIQRFQAIVYPDFTAEYKYVDRVPVGVDKARGVFDGLYALDLAKFEQLAVEDGGHCFVHFDPEAQEFFQTWLVDLELSLRNGSIGSSSLQGHFAKYRGFMPSLALIFHMIDNAAGNGNANGITLANAELAAKWCTYFRAHAERLYEMPLQVGLTAAEEILKKIEAGELGNEITAREIYRNKWSRLTEPADVKAGLEVLAFHDYLHEVLLNTGGKPKSVFIVNSRVKCRTI